MADVSDPRPLGLQKPAVFRELAVVGGADVADVPSSPVLVSGDGAPSLSRPRGSLYLDKSSGDAYTATDSAGTWALLEGGGAGLRVGETGVTAADIAYDDSATDILTVPAGQEYLITDVYMLVPDTAWDGNGTMIVGDDGDDDGFLSLSNANLAGSAVVGLAVNERGDLLFGSGSSHVIRGHILAAGESVTVTPTAGTSTQGEVAIQVHYQRID